MAGRAPSLAGLHLQFDPVSGIAGDMAVAALVDAGVPRAVVVKAVRAMGVKGLKVRFERRKRGAYVGQGFVVEEPGAGKRGKKVARAHAHTHEHEHEHEHGEHEHEHEHHEHGRDAHVHRDYQEIRRLLRRAEIGKDARRLAEEIFARLAEVEAALHGTSIDRVSFHEVGAYDSIADVVGVAAAIAYLAPASVGSSAPVLGTGVVRTAHGPVPVPAPATAALLHGVPVIADGRGELTTPTGAAILASVVDAFGPPPPLRLAAVGYGAGTRELHDRANVLRVLLGTPLGTPLDPAAPSAYLLEANIDDLTPQLVAALFDALFAAGALDVWSTSILMKKGRPAQQVSALVEPARVPVVERAFFLHSTTLGIRLRQVERATLPRSLASVRTAWGSVRVKIAGLDGQPIGAQPEFEDCRRLAAAARVPVRRVWVAALAEAAALVPAGATPPGVRRPPPKRSRSPARGRARRGRG